MVDFGSEVAAAAAVEIAADPAGMVVDDRWRRRRFGGGMECFAVVVIVAVAVAGSAGQRLVACMRKVDAGYVRAVALVESGETRSAHGRSVSCVCSPTKLGSGFLCRARWCVRRGPLLSPGKSKR